MAKRFTDTEKWKKPWYRKLGSDGRDIWNWAYENCNHAGILEIDTERMEFDLGFEVTVERLIEVLKGRVVRVDESRLFLPEFVTFQYGETLNPDSKPHKSVIKEIQKHQVLIGYLKGFLTIKDKDKDKDQDKDKDPKPEFDLELIYSHYPKRPNTGKGDGLDSLSRQLKTQSDFDLCLLATQNYAHYVRSKEIEAQFIKQFKTFCGSVNKPNWREWIEYAQPSQKKFNPVVPD